MAKKKAVKAAAKAPAKKESKGKKEVAALKKEGAEIVAEMTKLKASGHHKVPGMQKRLNEISSRLRVLKADTKVNVALD